MSKMIEHAFEQYSKLMVLRVDLSYMQSAGELTSEQVKADMRRFLDSKRFNQLFDNLVSMAWKLEYASGWHYHTIWFFNGHKIQKDVYYAQAIADRWKKMTNGMGCAYNCNINSEQKYQHNAMGITDRRDGSKRQYIDQTAAYLCKEVPLTKAQLPKRARTFGRTTWL